MRSVQVAVVGGGPAGLSAAIAAARAGARTVLLDENVTLGGQLRYRIAGLERLDPPLASLSDLAERLIGEARAAGVEVHPNAIVWSLFPGGVLAVSDGNDSYQLRADQIILATGSTDLPCTFPGSTLPGVMSARGFQILLHIHRILPGRRVAVIGTGTEAGEIRHDVNMAGALVVVQVDPARAGPSLAAGGAEAVQVLTVAGDRHEVDTVVVAVGRQPDVELALLAECETGFAAEFGGYIPLRDPEGRTSIPGLLVAGDAAGVCDVATAIADGRVAGLSAAATLGLVTGDVLAKAREDYCNAAPDRIAISASRLAVPTHL